MDIKNVNTFKIPISKIQNIYKKYRYKEYNYYKIKLFNKLYNQFILKKSSKHITHEQIFTYLQEISPKLIVSDLTIHNIIYKTNNDIYFNIESTQNKIENLFFYKNWYCNIDSEKKTVDITKSIKGHFKIKYNFNKELIEYPFTIFTILYDTKHKIIIDKSTGLQDIISKKIRIPISNEKYNEWIEKNPDNCLYYFLLLYYGYKPYNQETEDFIISYFNQHFIDIFMKKENNIERIKKFIIINIFRGKIIKDNIYLYRNINILEFISIIQKYTEKSNILKIIDSFDRDIIYGKIKIDKYPFPTYNINSFKEKYNKMILNKIPDINETYQSAFEKIYTISKNIYIYGGTVRDMLLDIDPTDIDITFDSTLEKIENLCLLTNWPCSEILPKYNKITFGTEKGITLEGSYKIDIFDKKMEQIDFTVNKLVYDIKNNLIIDITGFGLEDIINKKIRIPVPPSKYKFWAKDWKRPLLFFKMMLKGFTPINEETTNFVISYIENNFEEIYMKENEFGVPIIKYFLINILTHGSIFEETIVYGSTKKRLLEYIKLLKKYIKKDIFKKITNLFKEKSIEYPFFIYNTKKLDIVENVCNIKKIKYKNSNRESSIYNIKINNKLYILKTTPSKYIDITEYENIVKIYKTLNENEKRLFSNVYMIYKCDDKNIHFIMDYYKYTLYELKDNKHIFLSLIIQTMIAYYILNNTLGLYHNDIAIISNKSFENSNYLLKNILVSDTDITEYKNYSLDIKVDTNNYFIKMIDFKALNHRPLSTTFLLHEMYFKNIPYISEVILSSFILLSYISPKKEVAYIINNIVKKILNDGVESRKEFDEQYIKIIYDTIYRKS